MKPKNKKKRLASRQADFERTLNQLMAKGVVPAGTFTKPGSNKK